MLQMMNMQLARRAASASLAARRSALRVARPMRWFSTSDSSAGDEAASDAAPVALLPEHIKFRMPDLDFEQISGGTGGVTLSKWHAKEGDRITDGTHMVEIDTPDLVFVLDSGDEGFLARILVPDETKDVPPGQPLAIIVPTEEDVPRFVAALKQHPKAIEGYVEPTDAALVEPSSASASASTAASSSSSAEASSSSSSSSSSDAETSGDGAAVLRLLHKLHKDGHFQDEKLFKVLKSLARKNDAQLLVTYNGSFDAKDAAGDSSFDADFFVETAVELAEEALASQESTK